MQLRSRARRCADTKQRSCCRRKEACGLACHCYRCSGGPPHPHCTVAEHRAQLCRWAQLILPDSRAGLSAAWGHDAAAVAYAVAAEQQHAHSCACRQTPCQSCAQTVASSSYTAHQASQRRRPPRCSPRLTRLAWKTLLVSPVSWCDRTQTTCFWFELTSALADSTSVSRFAWSCRTRAAGEMIR